MNDKFDMEIKKDKFDDIHYLSTTRNGCQWSSMPIGNTKQMILIANALLEKAKEIESNPVRYCEDCAKLLNDLNTVKIALSPASIEDEEKIIYICSECDAE